MPDEKWATEEVKTDAAKDSTASAATQNAAIRPKFVNRPGGPGTGADDSFIRVRMPRANRNEVLGVIQENFGSKLLIKCIDGKTRICRIPGKIRYKLRVNLGDVVLVQKWIVQSDEKGDYLYKYTRTQVGYLVRRGIVRHEDLQI